MSDSTRELIYRYEADIRAIKSRKAKLEMEYVKLNQDEKKILKWLRELEGVAQ